MASSTVLSFALLVGVGVGVVVVEVESDHPSVVAEEEREGGVAGGGGRTVLEVAAAPVMDGLLFERGERHTGRGED